MFTESIEYYENYFTEDYCWTSVYSSHTAILLLHKVSGIRGSLENTVLVSQKDTATHSSAQGL